MPGCQCQASDPGRARLGPLRLPVPPAPRRNHVPAGGSGSRQPLGCLSLNRRRARPLPAPAAGSEPEFCPFVSVTVRPVTMFRDWGKVARRRSCDSDAVLTSRLAVWASRRPKFQAGPVSRAVNPVISHLSLGKLFRTVVVSRTPLFFEGQRKIKSDRDNHG